MSLVKPGEFVHLIERRLFSEDVRRHFIGKVEACDERVLRVTGHLFVFDSGSNRFLEKPEIRTRLVPLDNRIIFNVLPEQISIESLTYSHDSDGNLMLTDGAAFELDISEFGPKE